MMRELKAIIRPERVSEVLHSLHAIPDLPGVTISTVRGFGRRYPPDPALPFDEVAMSKLEIVVPTALVGSVVEVIARIAHTGRVGDGKIFVIPVEHAVRIRSGEQGASAL